MKTLSQIKDEVAKESGYKTWDLLHYAFAGFGAQIELFSDKVAKRYAEEAIKVCAERAIASVDDNNNFFNQNAIVDKQSILNIIKELK